MQKTFVGIGFGPIQSGLFALEAYRSNNFQRIVVADVLPQIVQHIRQAGGTYCVNVAGPEGVGQHEVSGIEIYDPADSADEAALVAAISEADEIATALPSVDFYCRATPSPARLIAQGILPRFNRSRPLRTVVYAAENHNAGAELLRAAVLKELQPLGAEQLDRYVQFINTVIGKMSGVVTEAQQIESAQLAPLVTGMDQAILVEQFNRILVGCVAWDDYRRGIDVFEEKPDLIPFEEAKLYGHNATHALIGYLAYREDVTFVSEVRATPLFDLARKAFVHEAGKALCGRHAGVDPVFTPGGWQAYVEDLLVRMTNPYLHDRVDRLIRDPVRKLGWDDRLIGTMRIALDHQITPRRFALGAAAAIELLLAGQPEKRHGQLFEELWGHAGEPASSRESIAKHVVAAREELLSQSYS
jgi:mannitol-1-phosphate 5-dehydrogenase